MRRVHRALPCSARAFITAAVAVLLAVFLLAIGAQVSAQRYRAGAGSTVQGDILRGEGAFLRGMAWYELESAAGRSIDNDTMLKWNQYVYESYQEQCRRLGEKATATSKKKKEAFEKYQYRIRENPEPRDISCGDGLNALLADLSNPSVSPSAWRTQQIPLPPAFALPSIPFRLSGGSGVFTGATILLSRLHAESDWPVSMRISALKSEREAYQAAAQQVIAKCKEGDPDNTLGDTVQALRAAVKALRTKTAATLDPKDAGFRAADRFINDLDEMAKLFNFFGYADELIGDTERYEAHTVGELLAFMRKFHLAFGSAESHQESIPVFDQLYRLLRQQKDALGLKTETPGLAGPAEPPVAKDALQPGSVWTGTMGFTDDVAEKLAAKRKSGTAPQSKYRLEVKERKGNRFSAEGFIAKQEACQVVGTIDGERIAFQNAGNRVNNQFNIVGTIRGKVIEFTYETLSGKPRTGKGRLALQ